MAAVILAFAMTGCIALSAVSDLVSNFLSLVVMVIARIILQFCDLIMNPLLEITQMTTEEVAHYIPGFAMSGDGIGGYFSQAITVISTTIAGALIAVRVISYLMEVADGARTESVPKLIWNAVFGMVLTITGSHFLQLMFDEIISPLTKALSEGITGGGLGEFSFEDAGMNIIGLAESGDAVGTIVAWMGGFSIVEGASLVVSVVFLFLIWWNLIKLVLECAERYIICVFTILLSPLAFATATNERTKDTAVNWMQMFWSQCVLLILNIWVVGIARTALNIGLVGASVESVVKWGLVTYAYLKIAQKLDDMLAKAGFRITSTTGLDPMSEAAGAFRIIAGAAHDVLDLAGSVAGHGRAAVDAVGNVVGGAGSNSKPIAASAATAAGANGGVAGASSNLDKYGKVSFGDKEKADRFVRGTNAERSDMYNNPGETFNSASNRQAMANALDELGFDGGKVSQGTVEDLAPDNAIKGAVNGKVTYRDENGKITGVSGFRYSSDESGTTATKTSDLAISPDGQSAILTTDKGKFRLENTGRTAANGSQEWTATRMTDGNGRNLGDVIPDTKNSTSFSVPAGQLNKYGADGAAAIAARSAVEGKNLDYLTRVTDSALNRHDQEQAATVARDAKQAEAQKQFDTAKENYSGRFQMSNEQRAAEMRNPDSAVDYNSSESLAAMQDTLANADPALAEQFANGAKVTGIDMAMGRDDMPDGALTVTVSDGSTTDTYMVSNPKSNLTDEEAAQVIASGQLQKGVTEDTGASENVTGDAGNATAMDGDATAKEADATMPDENGQIAYNSLADGDSEQEVTGAEVGDTVGLTPEAFETAHTPVAEMDEPEPDATSFWGRVAAVFSGRHGHDNDESSEPGIVNPDTVAQAQTTNTAPVDNGAPTLKTDATGATSVAGNGKPINTTNGSTSWATTTVTGAPVSGAVNAPQGNPANATVTTPGVPAQAAAPATQNTITPPVGRDDTISKDAAVNAAASTHEKGASVDTNTAVAGTNGSVTEKEIGPTPQSAAVPPTGKDGVSSMSPAAQKTGAPSATNGTAPAAQGTITPPAGNDGVTSKDTAVNTTSDTHEKSSPTNASPVTVSGNDAVMENSINPASQNVQAPSVGTDGISSTSPAVQETSMPGIVPANNVPFMNKEDDTASKGATTNVMHSAQTKDTPSGMNAVSENGNGTVSEKSTSFASQGTEAPDTFSTGASKDGATVIVTPAADNTAPVADSKAEASIGHAGAVGDSDAHVGDAGTTVRKETVPAPDNAGASPAELSTPGSEDIVASAAGTQAQDVSTTTSAQSEMHSEGFSFVGNDSATGDGGTAVNTPSAQSNEVAQVKEATPSEHIETEVSAGNDAVSTVTQPAGKDNTVDSGVTQTEAVADNAGTSGESTVNPAMQSATDKTITEEGAAPATTPVSPDSSDSAANGPTVSAESSAGSVPSEEVAGPATQATSHGSADFETQFTDDSNATVQTRAPAGQADNTADDVSGDGSADYTEPPANADNASGGGAVPVVQHTDSEPVGNESDDSETPSGYVGGTTDADVGSADSDASPMDSGSHAPASYADRAVDVDDGAAGNAGSDYAEPPADAGSASNDVAAPSAQRTDSDADNNDVSVEGNTGFAGGNGGSGNYSSDEETAPAAQGAKAPADKGDSDIGEPPAKGESSSDVGGAAGRTTSSADDSDDSNNSDAGSGSFSGDNGGSHEDNHGFDVSSGGREETSNGGAASAVQYHSGGDNSPDVGDSSTDNEGSTASANAAPETQGNDAMSLESAGSGNESSTGQAAPTKASASTDTNTSKREEKAAQNDSQNSFDGNADGSDYSDSTAVKDSTPVHEQSVEKPPVDGTEFYADTSRGNSFAASGKSSTEPSASSAEYSASNGPEIRPLSHLSVKAFNDTNGFVESDGIGRIQVTRVSVDPDTGITQWRIMQKLDADGNVPETPDVMNIERSAKYNKQTRRYEPETFESIARQLGKVDDYESVGPDTDESYKRRNRNSSQDRTQSAARPESQPQQKNAYEGKSFRERNSRNERNERNNRFQQMMQGNKSHNGSKNKKDKPSK